MKKTISLILLVLLTLHVFSQVPANWEGKVMTVNGLIPASTMGITLPHEHLLIVHKFNYLDLTDEATAITELGYYADAGGKTLAEASAIGIGRNPEGLKRISTATGINVIMCAGYYKDLWIPDSIKNKTIGQLSEIIINDIKNGINGIHAGFIKIAVSKPITPFEEKVLIAAAHAQKATGAALDVHFDGDHATVAEKHHVLDVVENEGVDLTRVYISHNVPYLDWVNDFVSLAKRGCYLSFDMLGLEVRVVFERERELAETLNALIDEGYLEQILISQDVCFSVCYVKNDGYGYAHILNNILPELKASGITDEEISTIMVENPKRLFPFKIPYDINQCVNETFTEMAGTITDNSGSHDYFDNMSCQKLIQPAGAVNITLTFNSFATESGYDFVKVYDGATTSSGLIGVYSGTALPAAVSSTGNSMLIVFTTDGGVVASGWSASYTSTMPSLEVTPGSQQISSEPGTTTFNVLSNIDWSVTEYSGWLTAVKTDASTLTVSYTENKSVSNRSAQITLNGAGVPSQNILVNQNGANPTLSISPEASPVSTASGTTTFTISSNIDWTVSVSSDWLTATKTDSITLTIIYDENKSLSPRSADIIVSGVGVNALNIWIDQSAVSPFLAVIPESRTVSSTEGTTSFTVSSNIDWSASENSDWLSIVKTDSISLTVIYDKNISIVPRPAEITVSGAGVTSQNILVTQSGASPILSIEPHSAPVSSASGSITFTVISNIDWSVSEIADWLSAAKTDATTLTVNYDENTSVDSRSAEVTSGGEGVISQSVLINQEGAIPTPVTSISDILQINVFPNPVSNKTWLTYSKGTAERIEIYEPSGRLIMKLQVNDRKVETEIDFSGFSSGLYLYRLVDQEGKIHIGKILKE